MPHIEEYAIDTTPRHDSQEQGELPVADTTSSNIEETTRVVRNSRKRKRNEKSWKRNKAKISRSLGEAYISSRGKEVAARAIGKGCSVQCRLKCQESFSQEDRQQIFSNFWSMGNTELQKQFVSKYVAKQQKARCYTNGSSSRRQFTYTYTLLKHDNTIKVCKSFFLATLGIRQDFVFNAISKQRVDGTMTLDSRGQHSNHVCVPESVVDGIREHIRSFPTMPSHYCRESSKKDYLEAGLNISIMYRLYSEKCKLENNQPAKLWKYRDIFNNEFNIGFHVPKKDQCDECLSFSNKNQHTDEETLEQEKHLKRKEAAREHKNEIKDMAIRNPSTVSAACFDLQQVLQCPHGQASSFYYKRKLSVYNLTLYDLGTSDVFSYIWPENISARGANQIASCVFDFLKIQAMKGKQKLYLTSDNCAGQNRNRFMATMLWYFINTTPDVELVEHFFLERGHTQNENDSVHSVISRAAAHIPVYTPEQWAQTVRGARRGKNPYCVKEMMASDFLDFKDLASNLKNFDKDDNSDKVYWSKIRKLVIKQNDRNALHIQYEFDVDPVRVDLYRGKRNSSSENWNVSLNVLSDQYGISEDKKRDLLALCKDSLIPPMYHAYFEGLPMI